MKSSGYRGNIPDLARQILGEDRLLEAEKFKKDSQILALKILGADRVDDALRFDYPQVKALKILGEERVVDALKFEHFSQVRALETLGPDRVVDALKFEEEYQVAALQILKSARIYEASRISLALRFISPSQVRALEILGPDRVVDALRFKAISQVHALSISGLDMDKALKFEDDFQYKALKILIKHDTEYGPIDKIIENALEFKTSSQIETLKKTINSQKEDITNAGAGSKDKRFVRNFPKTRTNHIQGTQRGVPTRHI